MSILLLRFFFGIMFPIILQFEWMPPSPQHMVEPQTDTLSTLQTDTAPLVLQLRIRGDFPSST